MAPLEPGTICSVPPTPAARRCRERACAPVSRSRQGVVVGLAPAATDPAAQVG